MLDSRPKGRGFEPHRRHCVVSLSKNINPSLVLVQPRKTRPFITEILLMGRKESNKQTNKGIQKTKPLSGLAPNVAIMFSMTLAGASSYTRIVFSSVSEWHCLYSFVCHSIAHYSTNLTALQQNLAQRKTVSIYNSATTRLQDVSSWNQVL